MQIESEWYVYYGTVPLESGGTSINSSVGKIMI